MYIRTPLGMYPGMYLCAPIGGRGICTLLPARPLLICIFERSFYFQVEARSGKYLWCRARKVGCCATGTYLRCDAGEDAAGSTVPTEKDQVLSTPYIPY